MDTPFHPGEQTLHELLGIRERMAAIGQRAIRATLPEQHQRFYEQLPFVLVGSVDPHGSPWASPLVGPPGFVRAASDTLLEIRARPSAGDPLLHGLGVGARLGLLGIELHSRRRNRANGRVVAADAHGFSLHIDQAVGNCPRFIWERDTAWARDPAAPQRVPAAPIDGLDAAAQALIARSDTLFVASATPPGAPGDTSPSRGADVSHRGGPPGFVTVEDPRTLLVPDYAGNHFFMTLGNLLLNPRAGVLFIDFETGDLLTLTGDAEVVWGGDAVARLPGAERAWRLHIRAGWRLPQAIPLRWTLRSRAAAGG